MILCTLNISKSLFLSFFLSFFLCFQLNAQEVYYLEEWYATEGEQEATASGREFSITDASSNLYVAGSSLNSHELYDFSLTKYNSSGTQLWSTTYNVPDSTGTVLLGDVTVDGAGNILATGSVYNGSTNGYDVFVVKYATDGTQSWARLYNGAGSISDGGTSLAVDASNNVYVGGGTLTASNSMDMLCLKYNSSGTFQWAATVDNNGLYDIAGLVYMRTATIVGLVGASEQSASSWAAGNVFLYASTGTEFQGFTVSNQTDLDEIVDFKIDASENVYVTGYTDAGGNGQDFKTVKLDDELDVIWETVYNGEANGDDRPNALALDNSGNTYVAGYTTGSGGKDYTVVKYNSSGVQQWASIYAGAAAGDDEALALTVGADGQVYVTGYANDNGTKDYFTRILDPSDGDKVWEAAFNGLENEDDWGTSIEVDGSGSIVVLGRNGTQNGNTEYTTVRYAKKELVIPPDSEAASSAISFIENRGQLTDTSGAEVPTVKFYSDASYPPVYIQDHKLSFVTSSIDTSAATPDTLHRVDMAFKGSKTGQEAGVFGMDQRDRYNNYYLGHIPEGRARVGLYERAVQTDVYEGIDLHYYSNQGGMKYYFVLSPGKDPTNIELEFDGQSSLSVDTNGDLVIGTSIGDFRLPAPEAYQVDSTGQEVSTGWTPSYSVSDSVVTFSASGSYDVNQSLVIRLRDGQTTGSSSADWITYFGGNDSDVINGSDIDGDGNFYIGGTTFSTSFPEIDPGIVQVVGNPGLQIPYMARFNTDASLEYLTVIGGTGPENGYDISVSDKAYLVGRTLAADFPATNGTPSPAAQGFIASFSLSDGSFVSSTVLDFLEGAETELYCVSAIGERISVGGQVRAGSFPTTSNGSWSYHDPSNSGGRDGLLVEFDSGLNMSWSTHFGGSGEESIRDVVITPNGKLFIAGNTTTMSYSATSCNVPTDSGFPSCASSVDSQFSFANGNSPALGDDIFIAEFNLQGNLSWTTFMGGSLREKLLTSSSIDVNGNNLVILGASEQLSTMQANTGGGFQQSITDEGYFVAEFANRSLVWKTDYGCLETNLNILNLFQSVVYGAQGGIYISGISDCATPVSSMNYCSAPPSGEFALCPPSGGTFYEDNSQGGFELFLTAFATDYIMKFATYFGGNEDEFITSLASIEDVLFLTGFTTSTQSFPVSFPQDSYEQDYNAGGTEGFIGRLNIGALVNSQEIESSAERLTLFPNPATDLLTISLPKDIKSHQREAHVYDMAGKLIMTKLLNHFETEVSIGNLPSGLYQVRVEGFLGRFIKI